MTSRYGANPAIALRQYCSSDGIIRVWKRENGKNRVCISGNRVPGRVVIAGNSGIRCAKHITRVFGVLLSAVADCGVAAWPWVITLGLSCFMETFPLFPGLHLP